MKRILPIVLLVLAVNACGNVFTPGAAVVNGQSITTDELTAEVDAALRSQQVPQGSEGQRGVVERQVLGNLIQRHLVLQEADRRGLKGSKAKVDAQLAQIKGQFPNEAEYRKQLKQAGFTEATLRGRIEQEARVDALRTKLAGPIDDKILRNVYQQEVEQFRQIRVRHILFLVDQTHPEAKAQAQAKAVLKQITAGAAFPAMARKYSQDTGSKAQGGLLPGWVSLVGAGGQGGLDPAFGRAAYAAPINKVVGPIRSSFGYHLIQTLDKRVQSFEDVRPQLLAQLTQQAGERGLTDFLTSAMRKANIVINPKFGDWNKRTGQVVEHRSFTPPVTNQDQTQPPGGFAPVFPGAPPGDGGTSTGIE